MTANSESNGEETRQPKLLLVEDDEFERVLASRVLASAGWSVTTADSAETALREVRAGDFDLVICDVGLPDRDGFSVCRALQQLRNPPIVIMLTGRGWPSDIVCGLEAGASDYLVKPCDPAELVARGRAMLRLRERLRASALSASTDPLTGLWNRHHLDARATEFRAIAARGDHPLSCIMLDLDRFKCINDEYGHPAGDEVLREVARRIQATVRRSDVVFRVGGEEFLILAPDSVLSEVRLLASRIAKAIRDTRISVRSPRGDVSVKVTASLGIAEWTRGATMEAVTARADAALLDAKRRGRNRVEA